MQTLDFSSTLALLPILDWLALGVLTLTVVLGAWRGLLYGVISVCGWVGAFLLAGQFGQAVGTLLPLDLPDARVRAAVGAALVFVVVLFASGAAAHLVRRLAAAAGMRPVDRILGAAFGALQAVLLGLVLVVMLGPSPVSLLPAWKEAHSVRLLQQLWVQIAPLFPALPQPTPPQAAPEKAAPAGAPSGAAAPAAPAAPVAPVMPGMPAVPAASETVSAPLVPVEVPESR